MMLWHFCCIDVVVYGALIKFDDDDDNKISSGDDDDIDDIQYSMFWHMK